MDIETIWQCSSEIPEEWYEQDRTGLERLIDDLSTRRKLIRRLISELRKSARNPFPNWQDSTCLAVPCVVTRDEAVEIR